MTTKRCPTCGAFIHDVAIECHYCGATADHGLKRAKEYVLHSRQTGIPDAAISQALLQAGWPQRAVDSLIKPPAPLPIPTHQIKAQQPVQPKKLRFSSKAIGGVNLLVYGSGYLVLHKYKRFFIALLALFIGSMFLRGIPNIFLYVFVIYDCIRLTHKIEKGEIPFPKANYPMLAFALFLVSIVLFSFVFNVIPPYKFATSEASCDILYPAALGDYKALLKRGECQRSVREGKSWFASGIYPTDKECKSEDNYLMKNICLLSKAIETRDPMYCQGKSQCVNGAVLLTQDQSFCTGLREGSVLRTECDGLLEFCEGDPTHYKCDVSTTWACDTAFYAHVNPESITQECMDKYGIVSLNHEE